MKCDAESKLITNYGISDATLHDSQLCTELLEDTDKIIHADSAYSSREIAVNLPENCENRICEKGSGNHPLTEEQQTSNRIKSKIRCRIEHIFGFMTNSMHGITVRSVEFNRACFNIGILNLVYNICRYEFLIRSKPPYGIAVSI